MIHRRTILIALLCNPLTSALLAEALLLDVRQLAIQEPGSTCGEWFGSNVMERGWQSIGTPTILACCAIVREGEGIRLVRTSPFDSTAAPGTVDWIAQLHFGTSRSGFWAFTRESTPYVVGFLAESQALTPSERGDARRLFVDNHMSGDPKALKRIRGENFTGVRTLWAGYLHNAISFTVLLLLVRVTWIWVRAIVRWFPDRRVAARVERGLCAVCEYPVVGLVRCPECGLAAAAKAV